MRLRRSRVPLATPDTGRRVHARTGEPHPFPQAAAASSVTCGVGRKANRATQRRKVLFRSWLPTETIVGSTECALRWEDRIDAHRGSSRFKCVRQRAASRSRCARSCRKTASLSPFVRGIVPNPLLNLKQNCIVRKRARIATSGPALASPLSEKEVAWVSFAGFAVGIARC